MLVCQIFHNPQHGDGTFSSPSLVESGLLTLSAEKLELSLRILPFPLTLSAAEWEFVIIRASGAFLPNVDLMGGLYYGLNIEDNPALESIVLPRIGGEKSKNFLFIIIQHCGSSMLENVGSEISNSPLQAIQLPW